MELLSADITRFQNLYATRFGVALEAKEARMKLLRLVTLLELTYQPITKVQLQSIKNENENEIQQQLLKNG